MQAYLFELPPDKLIILLFRWSELNNRTVTWKDWGLAKIQSYLFDIPLRKSDFLSLHLSELSNSAKKLGSINIKPKACEHIYLPSRSGAKCTCSTLISKSTQTNAITKILVFEGAAQINVTVIK